MAFATSYIVCEMMERKGELHVIVKILLLNVTVKWTTVSCIPWPPLTVAFHDTF